MRDTRFVSLSLTLKAQTHDTYKDTPFLARLSLVVPSLVAWLNDACLASYAKERRGQ
ncbi:hypothetical protein [Photobacterium minamisatsumaniensis]|uniref:hypothetical protein n=1 Tax=Photobacterium minamisatsumaniensis TaxID=2910233 RepID=UPI003D0E9F9E